MPDPVYPPLRPEQDVRPVPQMNGLRNGLVPANPRTLAQMQVSLQAQQAAQAIAFVSPVYVSSL